MKEAEQLVGQTLDRYHLTSLLATGGFGAVYDATHTLMQRRVALKVLTREQKGTTDRFFREARAAAAIGSPRIVEIYDCGVASTGHAFLAMEFLEGEDLLRRAKRVGPLPVHEVLAIADEMLEGLDEAHSAGIVHRDLKPANVFLTVAGRVVLLDFGISKFLDSDTQKLTKTGALLGTPHYMAPEQLMEAKSVDIRADIYAAGVTLHRILSGSLPFAERDFNKLATQILDGTFTRLHEKMPSLDRTLCEVIDRAMFVKPEGRWESAGSFRDALQIAAEGGDPFFELARATVPLSVRPQERVLGMDGEPLPVAGTKFPAAVPINDSASAAIPAHARMVVQNFEMTRDVGLRESFRPLAEVPAQTTDALYETVTPSRWKVLAIVGTFVLLLAIGLILWQWPKQPSVVPIPASNSTTTSQ